MNIHHLLPVLLAGVTAPVLANGGGYFEGLKSTGAFRPVNVDSVEMVSEKLDIELRRDDALVSITYQLHNPGKAVQVEMGFPCSIATRNGVDADSPKTLPVLEDFSLLADGKRVEAKSVRDTAEVPPIEWADQSARHDSRLISGWQVVKLKFAADQTRTLTVSYRNPYYRDITFISDETTKSPPMMRYLFSAAGLWAGPIKTGGVTIRATGVNPEVVSLSHPKRFQRDGSQWTWSFTDFEPTFKDDLEIITGEGEFRSKGYIARGPNRDGGKLRKNGKWSFLNSSYTAIASSSLKPDKDLTYGPENLGGKTWGKAWAEGADGDGIGESVTLTMDKPVKAIRLYIENGYPKYELFEQNNRVKRLAININGGAPFYADLPDGFNKDCWIDLPKSDTPVKTVKLTIAEVYRGTAFRDTCLSYVALEVPLSKAPVLDPAR